MIWYLLEGSADWVTRSLAICRAVAGSHAALKTSVCGARTGGVGNKSISEGRPGAGCIGAGEMAMTPATTMCEATRAATAPPIECPARIVRSGMMALRM